MSHRGPEISGSLCAFLHIFTHLRAAVRGWGSWFRGSRDKPWIVAQPVVVDGWPRHAGAPLDLGDAFALTLT
jgi:hypothetical protein